MNDQSQHISALTRSARPEVLTAIRQASAQTGVDFAYLLEKAAAESSFDPRAQAETSSARGLYQFVDRTWLDTMDRHAAAHGYPNVAKAIMRDAHGSPVVKDAAAEQYILSLRENPRISALMAAELAQDNRAALEASLGREVGNAELYMAHFLGAGNAAKFIVEREANGGAEAHAVVPQAARANTAVFYEHGKALSLDQVFARFEGRFGEAGAQALPASQSPAATGSDAMQAATIAAPAAPAASEPALAALQALQAAMQSPPERGTAPSLRADLANRMFTLSLLQAFNDPDDERSNEWLA